MLDAKKELRQALVWEMLQSARLSDSEVSDLLHKSLDPDHWRGLNPGLSVEAAAHDSADESPEIEPSELKILTERFAAESYFETGPLLPLPLVHRMRESVEVLRNHRWPPVFAFVYDEFWTISRLSPVLQLVTALLGPGSRQNSVIWTYYVDSRKGLSGWPPHADANGEHRLTIWIPLTDANVTNGCIYVIPRSSVPRNLPTDFRKWDSLTRAELLPVLQSVRALPARAGSLLGWDHRLIHWGSISEGLSAPRVSIGLEFVGGQVEPIRWELPMIGEISIPPLRQRLFIIGQRILEYKKFEPLMIRYEEFARQLVDLCQGQAVSPAS